jgi:hypothetical protein
LLKRSEIDVVVVVTSLILGACTLGPSTNRVDGLLLGHGLATSTTSTPLRMSGRILRLGPLGVEVDVVVIIGCTFLFILFFNDLFLLIRVVGATHPLTLLIGLSSPHLDKRYGVELESEDASWK